MKKYLLFVALIISCLLFFQFAILKSMESFDIYQEVIDQEKPWWIYDIWETIEKFPENFISQDILKSRELKYIYPLLSTWKSIEGVFVNEGNIINTNFNQKELNSWWISESEWCMDRIIQFNQSIKKGEKGLLDFWENDCILSDENFKSLHNLKYNYYRSDWLINILKTNYELRLFLGQNHKTLKDEYYQNIIKPILLSMFYWLTGLLYILLVIWWTYHMWSNQKFK